MRNPKYVDLPNREDYVQALADYFDLSDDEYYVRYSSSGFYVEGLKQMCTELDLQVGQHG